MFDVVVKASSIHSTWNVIVLKRGPSSEASSSSDILRSDIPSRLLQMLQDK